jgi:hypothetical protein
MSRFGEREGLTIVALGLVSRRHAWIRGDLAQESEGPGLVALLSSLAGEAERAHRRDTSLTDAASREERLAETQLDQRLPPFQAVPDGGSCRRHEAQGVLRAPFQDRKCT